jgi:hypothetical protein
MINIKKIAITLIVVDLLLITLSLYHGNHWLISSQSAFFSSSLVTLASFFGYKKMIEKKLEIGDIPKEDRDELDIIEDTHDLYAEEADLQEVIKEERAKIGGFKNTAVNLGKSASGAVSIFRLLSYAVLFLSFLYLNRHGLLNIMGYLTGLAVVPLVAFLSIFFKKPE